MQSLYLTEYIASPLFLSELKKRNLPYEAVLSDIAYPESPIPLFLLEHKPPQEHLLQYRSTAIEHYSQILIILGQLPLSFIQPILDKYTGNAEKKITIINLYAGMGSFGRKIAPELSDLSAFQYDIAKYEPLDMINLFHILEQNTSNTYIRIPHLHFPETIFSVEEMAIVDEQSLGSLEMLSLTGYGYAGNDATLITSGANFSTVLQLGDLLQEREIHVDIFVLSKLTIDMTEALKSSLHKTKKLIRITDQLPEILEPAIKKRLENFGCKDVVLQILSPQYERLTTIFDEFSAEQAAFDAKGLGERIYV